MEALVLMYHQIVPDGASENWVPASLADPRYGVSRLEFARQMAHLRQEGYRILALDELLAPGRLSSDGFSAASSGVSSGATSDATLDATSDERPTLVVTFDDGYETDLTLALPILSRLGIPATFFVATGHIGSPGMLTETMAAELVARPLFRIGGHGESHRFLSDMPEAECRWELARSLDRVREISGQKSAAMSAPGGRTSHRVADLARQAGFSALATSRPGLYRERADPFSIPRLPIPRSHSLRDFAALLDPRSLVHRKERWVRQAKQAARSVLSTLSPAKGG